MARARAGARLALALALVALCALAPSTRALRCYRVVTDCFSTCSQPISECSFQVQPRLAVVNDTECGAVDEYVWVCGRNLSSCTPPACAKNLAVDASDAVECAADEKFCFDLWRKPQNSRYGRTVVWGYENVHARGCARTCTPSNQSDLTGMTMGCCTADLCNAGARRGAGLWLALLLALAMALRVL
jgi:hypothetical protein